MSRAAWCVETGSASTAWVDGFQTASPLTTASGVGDAVPFMLCCKYDFVFEKCEEVGVILPRALVEGAGEKAGQKQERTPECGQAGRGPDKCILPWFGKGSGARGSTALSTMNWNI